MLDGLRSVGQPNLLLVAAGLVVLCTIAAAGLGARMLAGPKQRLRRRMEALGIGGADAAQGAQSGASAGQRRIQERLHELDRRSAQARRRNELHGLMQRAGMEPNLRHYAMISLGCGAATMLVAMASGAGPVWGGAIGLLGALLLPRLGLRYVADRRLRRFNQHFAGALDIVVRGIRSGLPVGQCFAIVGRETPDPVGEQFRRIVEGQRMGITLGDVLRRELARIPTPEFRFFAVVVQTQQQIGGNLSETLENLATMLRERKQMRDRVLALSSEAKFSAMMVGALPFLLAGGMTLIDGDYLDPLIDTRLGNVIAVGAVLWMGIGILWMRKVINFEI